jgi:hypothetical protein
MKKNTKITKTKLGMKVNIYLGSLPRPWKGPMQVRGPEAYTILWALVMKKNTKITNTKLGTKVNIYLGFFPRPCKGPMQVRAPEA